MKGAAALSKGLTILQAIADSPEPITALKLSDLHGLPLPTMQRILSTLVAHGLVERDPRDRSYRLAPRVLGWAQNTWERMDVRGAATPLMDELVKVSGETVQLALLSGTNIVTLERRDGPHPMRLFSSIGKRGPIHCTGTGKAMVSLLAPEEQRDLVALLDFHRFNDRTITNPDEFLAELQRVRANGYALDDEEHQVGVRCVAAPIADFRCRPAAAISLTAPVFRVPMDELMAIVPRVVEAARTITERIGGKLPQDQSAAAQ